MKRLAFMILTVAAASSASAQPPSATSQPGDQPVYMKFQDLQWKKLMPELGERSPESVTLRIDPQTKATQMMLRLPKNFHLPQHWHDASEALTILNGAFIIEDARGSKEELGPGSFIYLPRKMVHQGWTKPEEGALIFITSDGGFDINWTEGPPAASK